MDVALVAEGAYPHQFGGVSVWCDQLIRSLPEHRFHVVALVATGREPLRWTTPTNVTGVTTLALWGSPRRRPGVARRARRELLPAAETLLRAVVDPSPVGDEGFGATLRELAARAPSEPLAAALCSEPAVELLCGEWAVHWGGGGAPAITVEDAVTALRLLEHALRPLAHPPIAADVFHVVTNGLSTLPALAAAWANGTSLLLTEHGVYLREQYLHSAATTLRWPVKVLLLAFARRLCTLAYREATVVAPGNAYNRRWEERLGAPAERIRTVYNGVDPTSFPPAESEPATPTIAWAGRIDPVKDLETLLRAFARVREVLPTARLRLFGGAAASANGYLERCRSLAVELGLSEAACFEGRVAEIRDAYVAGTIVVLCSISEGFPYTLIEAMACGRPCVATEVGGVPEALGDTGLVVPPRDPERLARACLLLLEDEPLRRRLGAAARQRALGEFTLDRAVTAYDELYSFLGRGLAMPTAVGT